MTAPAHSFIKSPYATDAAASRGRLFDEKPSLTRTPFQRDRDRIIHSGAFRKLRNKTQVFIESEGDYYRTRLTHSLEVAQIARTIARVLGLDEDLTETLALAHDLGHTCFGHAGEEGLSRAMEPYGGFSHNEQTFRILTQLEKTYTEFDGLNLSYETLEGIVKHNGPVTEGTSECYREALRPFQGRFDLELSKYASAEAQVAALSDDIAYNTHDIDDGYRAGLFRIEDLIEMPLFGPVYQLKRVGGGTDEGQRLMSEVVREVMGLLINDLIVTTRQNINRLNPTSVDDIRSFGGPEVMFSGEMAERLRMLKDYLFQRMYRHAHVNRMYVKSRRMVEELFGLFIVETRCLPRTWSEQVLAVKKPSDKARIIADYIAGMTDRYAILEHRRLFSSDVVL